MKETSVSNSKLRVRLVTRIGGAKVLQQFRLGRRFQVFFIYQIIIQAQSDPYAPTRLNGKFRAGVEQGVPTIPIRGPHHEPGCAAAQLQKDIELERKGQLINKGAVDRNDRDRLCGSGQVG